jgi:UDP-glucose 4-epimerase
VGGLRRAVRRRSGEGDEVVIVSLGPSTNWKAGMSMGWSISRRACTIGARGEDPSRRQRRQRPAFGKPRDELQRAQFVFLSTVLVHGRSNDGRASFSENDVPTPRGLSGMSKAAAEAELRNIARDSGTGVTVIRPPLVYARETSRF